MFGLFKTKSKLGLDIGTSAIKMIELSQKSGRFNLENYGLFEMKSTTTDQSSGQSFLKMPDQEVVWGVKQLLSASNFRARDVVASIPAISTFTTVIEMPYLSEEELAKAIPFEAKKYVPVPLNEVVLDWAIVGLTDQNKKTIMTVGSAVPGPAQVQKGTMVEIFIAAVPKDETARYQRMMRDAGLNLIALELENSGLIRGLLGNDLSPTAVVNIGGRSTSILIVNKGYERVSHNYEVGGYEITKAIARSLDVSIERAEELKRKFGLTESADNLVRGAILDLVDMMIFETKKTIAAYEEAKGVKISRVVLVGGVANMPDFTAHFKAKLERDVFIGNVFSRVIFPPELTPALQELSNVFSISAGLAMRDD